MAILSQHPEELKPSNLKKDSIEKKSEPLPPHAYRASPDFRYTMRLQSPKSETRAIVRVFEAKGPHPDRVYLTPTVLLGNYEIFPKGVLIVESPKGGWRSEEASKQAVRDLLSTHPGDKNIPREFFSELNEIQIGFLCEMNADAKFQSRRMES
jgi:hypothetical protein